MVRVEVIEVLIYECSTWTLRQEDNYKLSAVHHRVLFGIIGSQRKRLDQRMTPYNHALEINRCDSIQTTLRTRFRLCAGALIRMSGGRLPKRTILRNIGDAVRRGECGKEKELTTCVQSDLRAVGIAGDSKATASAARVWVETVTESGRGLIAAWRK